MLLSATAMGLASRPVTEPLEVSATRSAVQDEVFGGDGYAEMLLRVGWAPVNAEPFRQLPGVLSPMSSSGWIVRDHG